MYFLVVIFHIRATSSPLSALVFMSQIVVYTIRLNVPLHMYIENKVTGSLEKKPTFFKEVFASSL